MAPTDQLVAANGHSMVGTSGHPRFPVVLPIRRGQQDPSDLASRDRVAEPFQPRPV